MATKLMPEQKLQREFSIPGVESPVIVTLSTEGISMRVPGTKLGVSQSWDKILSVMETPPNVPSYLMGFPAKFLQHQVEKKSK